MDPRRWILVEAWLALGLRLEWAPSYERVPSDEWIDGTESGDPSYCYRGHGVWWVQDQGRRTTLGFTRPRSPTLDTDSMLHELAHYLAASPSQREERNFGLKDSSYEDEDVALQAQKVIDAILDGASRAVEYSTAPRRRAR